MRIACFVTALIMIGAMYVIGQEPEKSAGFFFPKVEGWEVTTKRPLQGSISDYSVGYNSKNGTAVTIYIYARGLTQIPADLSSDTLKDEWATVKAAILEAKRLGFYRDVEELGSKVAEFGPHKAFYAQYRIVTAENVASESEMYLFPYRNQYVKIRATRRNVETAETQSLQKLYAKISEIMPK